MSKIYYVGEDSKNGENFGRIEFEGKEYILCEQAEITNRYLSTEKFEMSARAKDQEGNEFISYWVFENVENWELDQYDYDNIDRVEAL